jgi:hypothetical protein
MALWADQQAVPESDVRAAGNVSRTPGIQNRWIAFPLGRGGCDQNGGIMYAPRGSK